MSGQRAASRIVCSPSFATRRRPERPNLIGPAREITRLLGLELMPWQELVIEVATEYDPVSGVPFYREVFVTTPRQAGKSTVVLVLLILRCLFWDRPQACVWTGQDGASIRRKWLNEIVPSLERSELGPLVAHVRRTNGSEAVEWSTGSRIELLPTSETAGHGMVLDFCVLDEIFADHDNRREAALIPAMSTKRDAQMLVCSTAGTASSIVYNRKVRAGRAAVDDDRDSGMCYFEWSAPDGWDPDDDESFYGFHPAVGYTIDLSVIRQARDTLFEEPGEFARAYGNRPQLEGSDVFPAVTWGAVVRRDASAGAPVALGVDVSPQFDAAAVAVVDGDGVIELARYEAGVDWVAEAVKAAAEKYGVPFFFDKNGPAGRLEGFDHRRLARGMTSKEVLDGCAQFFHAVVDRKVTVRFDPVLDRAVAGLDRKDVGDAYCWSRRSRHDVTPLYAATLAYAGLAAPSRVPPAAMHLAVR